MPVELYLAWAWAWGAVAALALPTLPLGAVVVVALAVDLVYVRNPMQFSAVVLLFLVGLVIRNPWVAAAGVMAHLYSIGFAGWDEEEDLKRRFGERWIAYRRGVRRWLPQLRPWHRPDGPPARLFVAEGCGQCGAFDADYVRACGRKPRRLRSGRARPGAGAHPLRMGAPRMSVALAGDLPAGAAAG